MRRALFALSLGLVVAMGTVRAEEAEEGLAWSNDPFGVSLRLPPGFKLDQEDKALKKAVPNETKVVALWKDKDRAVSVEVRGGKTTVKQYADVTTRRLYDENQKRHALRYVKVSGREAVVMDSEDKTTRRLSTTTVFDDRLVTVTCSAPGASWGTIEKGFTDCLDSLAFDEKRGPIFKSDAFALTVEMPFGFRKSQEDDELKTIGENESKMLVAYAAPPRDGFANNVNVLIQGVKTTGEAYAELTKKELEGPGWKLHSIKHAFLGKHEAIVSEFEGTPGEQKCRFLSVATIFEDKVVIVTCTARADEWEKNADAFGRCIDSVAFEEKK
jgi:hypothetical protein